MRNKPPAIRILTIHDQKIVLDSDLAYVYGVPTKVLNQAFRRARSRFPRDFAFQLSADEYDLMRSQLVTASGAERAVRSQVVTDIAATSAIGHGHSPNTARCKSQTYCEAIVPSP